MSQVRPAVPAALKRKLYEEAGYRCAVPTCRATSGLQMEHIEQWSLIQRHDFENMIVLCANCHARVTAGEISKDAIRAYKRNLAIVSGRYSLYEMRVLECFHEADLRGERAVVAISEHDLLQVKGLLDDHLVELSNLRASINMGGIRVTPREMTPTSAGWDFISNYFQGQPLE